MKIGVTDVKSYTPAYLIGVVCGSSDYFCGGMNSVTKNLKMAASKEMMELYELILESPGLSDLVKLDGRITCRTALFAVLGLEYAMSGEGAANPLGKILTGEDREALKGWMEEILGKARLKGFYEKLRRLA
jgi:hypothetical protein